jgi:hypothetical protein
MTKEELWVLLHQNKLGRIADQLIELAAPAIRIYVQGTDEADIPIGASKLGGSPDLPEGVPWQAWHESMAFIGQINLAEAAPYDIEHLLPPYGLLSFFYETDGEPLYAERWGLPEDAPYMDDSGVDISQSWQVLYHSTDPATFQRREIPSDVNEWARYRPSRARFALEHTLPDVDGPEIQPLGPTADERHALIGIDHDVNYGKGWEEDGHHLLGYPYDLDGPALVGCGEEGRKVWDVWGSATPEERVRMQRDAAAKWRLLLQLSGSDVTEMTWGGGGVLHICITHEALRARDFSGVWFDMAFL